jgi:hypothetical protein
MTYATPSAGVPVNRVRTQGVLGGGQNRVFVVLFVPSVERDGQHLFAEE